MSDDGGIIPTTWGVLLPGKKEKLGLGIIPTTWGVRYHHGRAP